MTPKSCAIYIQLIKLLYDIWTYVLNRGYSTTKYTKKKPLYVGLHSFETLYIRCEYF